MSRTSYYLTADRDRKLTASQNYKRLGLSNRLRGATGGVERTKEEILENEKTKSENPFAIPSAGNTTQLIPQQVEVERDPETGRILRVIRNEETSNPLNDPLNEVATNRKESAAPKSAANVVAQLEAEAEQESEYLATKKRPRQQSQREEEWILRLIEKHGDNIRAMVRDRRLNPMQQTEGDINRRIKKWKKSQQVEG